MLRIFNLGRLQAMAELCDERGDGDTARLFRDQVGADECRSFDIGWRILCASVIQEESQVRVCRAVFCVVELAAEAVEFLQLRKVIPKCRVLPVFYPA